MVVGKNIFTFLNSTMELIMLWDKIIPGLPVIPIDVNTWKKRRKLKEIVPALGLL